MPPLEQALPFRSKKLIAVCSSPHGHATAWPRYVPVLAAVLLGAVIGPAKALLLHPHMYNPAL